MYEGLDTVILYDGLAYEDVLPVAWKRLEPLDPAIIGSYADHNLRVLQALSALEEQGPVEKPDEDSPHSADILRLDVKLNLLLDMVGALLVSSQPRPPLATIRFNALGAAWQSQAPFPELGQEGMLEIYVRECIANPLRLAGRIASISPDGRAEMRFISPGEHIADLMEQLAFRKHRRQVAGARQPKKK